MFVLGARVSTLISPLPNCSWSSTLLPSFSTREGKKIFFFSKNDLVKAPRRRGGGEVERWGT